MSTNRKKPGIMVWVLVCVIVLVVVRAFTGGEDGGLTESEKTEIFAEVPEEYHTSYFFRWLGLGDCEKLTGKVLVTIVFVDDTFSSWSDSDKQKYQTDAEVVFDQLEADAKGYGVQLDITTQYITAESEGTLSLKDSKKWVEKAISSAGLPERSKMGTELEKKYAVDHAPVVFCVNRDGRSFAQSGNVDRYSEYAVIYEDTTPLYHEFCHLFGAEDFYYPDDVKKIAEEVLGESVMLSSTVKKVDDLTAFLIGWTNTLSEDALLFLEKTEYVTDEYMETKYAEETYTGYVENKTIGDTTYTGKLVDGILEGEGKKERDGNVWEGTFVGGVLNGKGKFCWSNGDTYVGDFINGTRNGQGTYTWADGDKYEGMFVNGIRTGQGTYTWANGNVYTGNFVDGKRTGQGTFIWYNGDKYEGSFVDGTRTGQGTYTWTNGDTYVGQFKDNEFHGQGTYTWASGKVRKGTWKNGKFVG